MFLTSLFAAESEKPKIGIGGKGLMQQNFRLIQTQSYRWAKKFNRAQKVWIDLEESKDCNKFRSSQVQTRNL